MKVKILIALKSFEAKQLSKIHDDYGLSNDSAEKILAYPKAKDPSGSRLVDSSGTKVPSRSKQRGFSSLASIALPKKHSNYTVLRSPHIDKKSRDQFEFKIHKQLIIISTQIQQIREKLFNLKLTNVPGVQMTVVFQTKTRLSDIKV